MPFVFEGRKYTVTMFLQHVKDEFTQYTTNSDTIVIDPTDVAKWRFITNLLSRHPTRSSEIVTASSVMLKRTYTDRFNGKYYFEIEINSADGEYKTISWKKCTKAKPVPTTNKTKLNEALRNEITYQIHEFYRNSDRKCVVCRSTDSLEVDHKLPFFCDIRDNFLQWASERKLMNPHSFAKLETGGYIFRDEDQFYREKWRKFHEDHCDLQVLCKQCHNHKTYKRDKLLKVV